jgi:NAD(P)-dependent dehydrogenase (short-subunit alcohol dehydrogenase family)
MPDEAMNAIVTGAASGLGRALALRLAAEGWHVAICDIDDARAEETLGFVRSAGGSGQVEHLDVTSPEQWQALRQRLQASWSHLDLLVNNAGVAGAGEVGSYSLDDWHWMVNVNLWSGIYGCHTFVEWLKQNPRGSHIINTASMAAVESAPATAAYNLTKAGIFSLSETLYAELLPHCVGVTVVCPAFFATNLLASARFSSDRWLNVFGRLNAEATLTADQVADRAVRAMRRKRLYVMLPASARWRWYLKRLGPQSFMRGVSKAVHRLAGS